MEPRFRYSKPDIVSLRFADSSEHFASKIVDHMKTASWFSLRDPCERQWLCTPKLGRIYVAFMCWTVSMVVVTVALTVRCGSSRVRQTKLLPVGIDDAI